MTAPDPLFLLQNLQTRDSRLYDFLRFLLRKVDGIQSQVNSLAAIVSGSAIGGSGTISFGAGDTTLSGTITDARVSITTYIICAPVRISSPSVEDFAIEEIHIIVTRVIAGGFDYVVHAPSGTTGDITFNWIGVT